MADIIEKLLVVQEHDCQIMQIERELRDIPARKQHLLSSLDEHKKKAAELRELIKKGKSTAKELELECESRRQKILALRNQQMQVKKNEEFKAIETEIRTMEQNITGIEDKELETMEQIERSAREADETSRKLVAEESRVSAEVASLDERIKETTGRLESLKAIRAAAARDIDADWLTRYEKILQNRGDKAVVAIKNGVCGGCFMELPAYIIHNARQRTAIVACGFCGRILY